jgi:hypothetical protein
MFNIKNIFIKLGQLDRRLIYLLVSLSVLIPLLNPNLLQLPTKTTKNTQIVFDSLNDLKENDKVLLSFEYGASTKPEIHPMSIAILNHLFSKGIKVYIVSLWPEGVMMAADAINEIVDSNLFKVEYGIDYINLGYKQGGPVVIRGIATNIGSVFTQDVHLTLLDEIPMMNNIKDVRDFDFVFDLSAGFPGNAEWVQYACDEYKIPLSSGCTSIMVTDAIPYVESGQLKGIIAGMPGAAEYENLVYDYLNNLEYNKFMNKNVDIKPGKATSRMSAQSITHLLMVLFIIFGNISYYLTRKKNN